MANITVNSDSNVKPTVGAAPSTVSRRADGQPEEGPNSNKAVTPGASSSRTGLEAAEQIGVTHKQGAELTESSVARTSIEASHTDH